MMQSELDTACETPPILAFTYLYLYVNVFDGDIGAWQSFLRTIASPTQIAHDAPVVERLAAAVKHDPLLPERIRDAVRTIDDVVVTLTSSPM